MKRSALLLVALGRMYACTCGPASEAPACEKLASAEVIFLGKARALEPDPNMPAGRAHIYKFDVYTPYKGLPLDTAEVIVDPDNSTSCGTWYRIGATYLMFGRRYKGDRILSSGCSGSRLAEYTKDDLRFLDAYKRNESVNAVYGRVLQSVTLFGRPIRYEDAPVGGATVVLHSDSVAFTQKTTSDGDFRFEALPPGSYSLWARLDPYEANPATLQVSVPAVGCAEVFPVLAAHASISGTLSTNEGKPAPRMKVELLRRNNTGDWYRTYQFWKQTDSNGAFQFDELPSGDYLLGYEIWADRPSSFSAHPTRYYPGTDQRAQATILHLAPKQQLQDLQLALGKPHTPRQILVQVLWPDGTAPNENLLQILDGESLLARIGGGFRGQPGPNHGGSVDVSGFAERPYDLSALYFVDELSGPVPHDRQRIARSETFHLEPGSDPATVTLVLTRHLLRDDDR